MSFVKFGIIGCGQVASFHMAANKNNPKVKFIAAYDIDEKKVQKFSKKHKLEPFTKLDALLESDIDAVYIMLPHYLHGEVTIAAAKAGKHVICEKPMATSLEECDRMIEATRKAKVKFMIAENHRFLPAHTYIKDIVKRNFIGDIFFGRAYEGAWDEPSKFQNPDHWMFSYDKGGGGALFDQGVHKFATLNWILEDNVDFAQCWCIKSIESPPNKGEDTALVHLHFTKGAVIEVSVTTAAIHPPTNRLELHGTKGSILEDHSWQKPVQIFSSHEEAEKKGVFYSPEIEHGPFPKYYIISFRYEDTHFAECILEDKEPEFSPEEAKEAVAVAHLAYLASKKATIATMDELKKLIKKEGTASLFKDLEHAVQKNYEKLKW
ncbi:MAG: Gfo/Idh/MocA family protein [Candidatus Helarchaeota archaeon]